jgi:hypothetical protein
MLPAGQLVFFATSSRIVLSCSLLFSPACQRRLHLSMDAGMGLCARHPPFANSLKIKAGVHATVKIACLNAALGCALCQSRSGSNNHQENQTERTHQTLCQFGSYRSALHCMTKKAPHHGKFMLVFGRLSFGSTICTVFLTAAFRVLGEI